jgi:hypothetical protein
MSRPSALIVGEVPGILGNLSSGLGCAYDPRTLESESGCDDGAPLKGAVFAVAVGGVLTCCQQTKDNSLEGHYRIASISGLPAPTSVSVSLLISVYQLNTRSDHNGIICRALILFPPADHCAVVTENTCRQVGTPNTGLVNYGSVNLDDPYASREPISL